MCSQLLILLILTCSCSIHSKWTGSNEDPPRYDHGLGLSTTRPLNIAHRGSSGMYPENTLEAMQLAVEQGSDMIEMDVCLTKDLHLVCLHESWISGTTNVADVFPPDRMNTYTILGRTITDYFTVDFTLEELKRLGVRQRFNYRDPNYDFLFPVATVEEYIIEARSANRTVALLPELKDTPWVNSLEIVTQANTTFEDLTIDLFHEYGYFDDNDPVVIQSFFPQSVLYIGQQSSLAVSFLSAVPLPNSTLETLSQVCYAIGVTAELVVRTNVRGQRVGVTDLVERARFYGLRVHAWTLKNEDRFLAWDYQQDPYLEYHDFVMNALVDGVITDFPATFDRYLNVLYEEC